MDGLSRERGWSSGEQRALEATGELFAMSVLRDRHENDLVATIRERDRLEEKLFSSTEVERGRLGRELHDGVCQDLKSLEILAELLPIPRRERRRFASRINAALRRTYAVVENLVPIGLDAEGLKEAFCTLSRDLLIERSVEIIVDCETHAASQDGRVGYHLYCIGREAVRNAVIHGEARRVEISLKREAGPADRHCCLRVSDDGCGVPTGFTADGGGRGIPIMKARARAIGASVEVRSRRGEDRPVKNGVVVVCRSQGHTWRLRGG